MNNINFLPQSFIAEQVRRVRRFRHMALIAFVIVAMGGWAVTARGLLKDRQAFAESLQVEVDAARRRASEMGKLRAERAALARQVKIQRELALPLSQTTVIATLGQLLPDSMVVTNLKAVTQRPKSEPASAASGKSPKKAARPADEPDYIRIDIAGLAPNDVELAEFVGRLSSHPLFTNVKMHRSKSGPVGQFITRQFSIEMDVPLDREYRDASQRAAAVQEVSDAH